MDPFSSFETFLSAFPHFQPAVFEEAQPYLRRVDLPAGEHFLEYGHICREIAFIESGLIRLYYLHEGKEVTLCFCRENHITTSYQSLVSQTPSEIAIQTIEPTRLITLSYESLEKLYAKDLFWQQLGRLTVEQEYLAVENHRRLVRDLPGQERYAQMIKQESALLDRVPLNYLASYLQLSPETLSRIRKKMSLT
ncbi:MAG: Crp/Fnr family transcriptional regulator [Bacteroidota bacterium]